MLATDLAAYGLPNSLKKPRARSLATRKTIKAEECSM